MKHVVIAILLCLFCGAFLPEICIGEQVLYISKSELGIVALVSYLAFVIWRGEE